MSEDRIKCAHCGAELDKEALFCSRCGQAVVAIPPVLPSPPPVFTPPPIPSPAAPPPLNPRLSQTPPPTAEIPPAAAIPPAAVPALETTASSGQEKPLCVIGKVTSKTGLFSSVLFHMIVTDKRLIFAHQTKEMQETEVREARERAKKEGKGFFGKIGAQLSANSGEKYMGWIPDQILGENPQNFDIPLDLVSKITPYHGDFEDNSPDTMDIITPGQKYTFIIQNCYNVERQLKAVLGSKVK